MDYVVVGFVGVVLGALAAGGIALLLLRRMTDRDLVERRLRTLVSLREALGAPGARGDPAAVLLGPLELEQAIHDFQSAAREFRLSAWIFDEDLRADLAGPIHDFEDEMRA